MLLHIVVASEDSAQDLAERSLESKCTVRAAARICCTRTIMRKHTNNKQTSNRNMDPLDEGKPASRAAASISYRHLVMSTNHKKKLLAKVGTAQVISCAKVASEGGHRTGETLCHLEVQHTMRTVSETSMCTCI